MPRPTPTTAPRLFVRTLAGTLLLGGTVTAVAGSWSTSTGQPAARPASRADTVDADTGAGDDPGDQLLVAGPDGAPLLDADGDVLVVDLSEATAALAGDGVGDGIDAEGDAEEWIAHEHVDELTDAGAITALDPADPALADICGGSSDDGDDPCGLEG